VFEVSLHESITLAFIFIIMSSILWKWSKVLLIVVNLEMASAVILARLFMIGGLLSNMILCVLIFFVREALIILSSFYRRIRTSGAAYGRLNS